MCFQRLTKHIDKSISQQVAKLIGGVALVDSAGAGLDVAQNHCVVLHLPTRVLWRVYQGDHRLDIQYVTHSILCSLFLLHIWMFIVEG